MGPQTQYKKCTVGSLNKHTPIFVIGRDSPFYQILLTGAQRSHDVLCTALPRNDYGGSSAQFPAGIGCYQENEGLVTD
jgi:hypothetical protein